MSKAVIYQIKNNINGKVYIGSTTDKERRWCQHEWLLNNNQHPNDHLQRAWNKYGSSNFELSVLETIKDQGKLLDREQYYLDKKDPEYNIANDAEAPMLGRHHTDKTRKKMSKSTSQNNPMYGKEHTGETKQKLSEIMSRIHRGSNNPNATLNEKKVKIIKYLLGTSNFSQKQIGRMFGVSYSTISGIKAGNSWKSIKITATNGR